MGMVGPQEKPSFPSWTDALSSAPKFPRRGTTAWKTCQLRIIHGARQAKKIRADRVALARAARNLYVPTHRKKRDGWGTRSLVVAFSVEPRSIHTPQMGMKRAMVELSRTIIAERMAKMAQGVVVWGSVASGCCGSSGFSPMALTRRAIAMSFEKRKVVMAMSQIQRTAYCMAAG